MSAKTLLRKIPNSKLAVSEPNPSWFGNKGNEAGNPKWTNKNWLKSRFHFSFAEYNNPRNTNFGVLRVLNDDLVQPARGFGSHPHRDVEICTYVVEGKLTHADSMGTDETLERGAIQFMTAGSGVVHSEHNLDADNPLRFIQIWINTRQRGVKPNYGSLGGTCSNRLNQWAHLVSDVLSPVSTPIKINQDANIHVTEISKDQTVTIEVKEGRQAYLLCVEGSAAINVVGANEQFQNSMDRHDAAELFGPVTISASPLPNSDFNDNAHMLMVEMEFSGVGRTDL